jgi:tetratricopeptide (TPR) repeat protein
MKLTLRLASACVISMLLIICNHAEAALPTENLEQATEKENDATPSVAQIQASLKREPNNATLYIKLGQAYWNSGDYQPAFDAFKQSVKLAPASAEAHNWMGAFLMGRGNLPDSISELRKAVSLDPKYARAYTNLGSALAKSGDLGGAVTAFQKAVALEPNSWASHLNLGLALRENGDAAGALVHLRRVAQAQATNPTVQCELGQTLRQNGDLAAATAAFERALEIDPEMREAYYGLGFTLKQQAAAMHKAPPASLAATNQYQKEVQDDLSKGDLNSAKEQLLKTLAADVNDGEAHNLLGYILGQQGDTSSALPHLERAAALRPDSTEVHYNYGAALWYSGAKQKAISELTTSIRLDPSAAASYALLGMAQRDEGDLPASRLNLERALALSPTSAATFIDLGIVFLKQAQLQRALAQFEAGLNATTAVPTPDWDGAIFGLRDATSKGPDLPEIHNMVGLLLGRRGADSNEVLAEFRQALGLRPDYAEAHNNMGLVLAQNGDDEKAAAEFREASRVHPDYADAHANLGAVLLLSDVEGAIAELEKAVSLDPTLIKAQFNLAEAYGNSPSHGTAKQIEQLRKIISIAPEFARAHLALGKALLHDAKVNDAVGELRDATRLDPTSGEAHYQLGLALARSGQQEEAAAEVKKGRELSSADERNQNAELDVSEGRAAIQKGELQEAESKFRHAIKLQPNSPVAQHLLGMTLEKEGNTEGAVAVYQKAVELNPGDMSARQSMSRLKPAEAQTTASPDLAGSASEGKTAEDDPAKISEFENYIRESRYSEVEPLITTYVKERPNSSWGWYALGYTEFAQKKIGDSIKSLAQSLSLNAKNADAHKILGRDLMVIGRFDAAQTEFEQAIRYAPNLSESYYDLGKLYSLQDNWLAARKQFEEAIRLEPGYIEAIAALGFAQEALSDDAAALATYQKAIALNEERHGKFVAAHVNLSAYYNRTGNPAKALEYAQKALELDPRSDSAWFQKARAEERQGQLQTAADSLNHAISLNQRSSSYYYVLSGIYRRLGNLEQSKKALESFTRLDQESNDLEKMRRNMSKSRAAPHPGGDRE